MWGAIIGDLAGSIYEFGQIKNIKHIDIKEIIPDNAFFSDDTILTIAILDAILHDKNYEGYLRMYGNRYLDYRPDYEPYFRSSFSPGFIEWLKGEEQGKSIGNGAMMRVSPIGLMFDNEMQVISNSKLATIPSHNSIESIECAKIISLIIFYAKQGMTKEEIIRRLNLNIEYKPFERFNSTCSQTIGNCLYAIFTSNSFEESIKNVISYGGDTDTNGCIVGAMAEAFYNIDDDLIKKAKEKIPQQFIDVLEKGYRQRRILRNKSEDYER